MEKYIKRLMNDIDTMEVRMFNDEDYIKKEDVKWLIETDTKLKDTVQRLISRTVSNRMRSIPTWKCPYHTETVQNRPCKNYKSCDECRNGYEEEYRNQMIDRYVGEEYREEYAE